jgi:hypothetical protein
MALPTNIFIGKAKANAPATKKFSTHTPWAQPQAELGPETNPDQSQIKVETNPDQSQIKVETNPDQSQIKVETNPDQSQIKVSTISRSKSDQNPDQTQIKPRSKFNLSSIVGLQRNIINFVFEESMKSRDKHTAQIALQVLADACKTTKMAAQVATRRLEAKTLLMRVDFKNGRGGWTKYQLPFHIFQELLTRDTEEKLRSKSDQNSDQSQIKPRAQPRPSLPIVVVPSSLSLKTTTIETEIETPCFLIPNELSGMVSRRQLNQFVLEGKISEFELQMSLDAFAYDLRNKLVSTKHTANPVGLLIGAIKNNGGYNSQKFAEALKSEMKIALSSQQTSEDSLSALKTGESWSKYQDLKKTNPEAFSAFTEKYQKQGLKGELLEEFGFLDFQAQKSNENLLSELNPLRPAGV